MALESATFLSQLITSNPLGTDFQSQGDDHIRLLKSVLQATFPNADRPFRFPSGVAVVTSSPTLAVTDSNEIIPVDASAAARTVTMPSASLTDGLTYYITKVDSSVNAVTIAAAAEINGEASILLRFQWDTAVVRYNLATTTWYAEVITSRFGTPRIVVGDATLAITDYMARIEIDADAASRTVTLPSTLPTGFRCVVQKIDSDVANTVTLSAAASVNGSASVVLREQWEEIEIWWNGTTWRTWDLGTRLRTIDTLVAARFSNVEIQAFTGSGTYTPTSGMKYCIVLATGGGGGGGGADAINPGSSGGGGGGAGGTTFDFFTAAEIGASRAVTIGAAGDGGADTGGDGTAGGNTILAGPLLTAPGGAAGGGRTTQGTGAGGAGGAPTGSVFNIPGGDGGIGYGVAIGGGGGDGRTATSGQGGTSFWGGGARGIATAATGTNSTTGVAGRAFGAGGSGAAVNNTTTGAVGGAGAPGGMLIIEFI